MDLNVSRYYFVKQNVRKGIFPIILEFLLDKRKEVRKYAKDNEDKLTKEELSVYDAI